MHDSIRKEEDSSARGGGRSGIPYPKRRGSAPKILLAAVFVVFASGGAGAQAPERTAAESGGRAGSGSREKAETTFLPPDAYEGAPFHDNTASTTLNMLVWNSLSPQDHTFHSNEDVDWGVCAATAEGALIPYSLRFTNLVIPPGSAMQVDLYEDGPQAPPTIFEFIQPWDTTFSISWMTAANQRLYFAVRPLNTAASAMSYGLAFHRDTGVANSPRAVPSGPATLRITWQYATLAPPDTRGFAVLRSASGDPGSFQRLNAQPIPIPAQSGADVVYEDSAALSPATLYYYQIHLIAADGVMALYTPVFCGYLPPGLIPTPTPPTAIPAGGCVVY